MTDQQPNSTSDELQQGLDTTADLAGNAVKHGLPSRSPKGISRSVGNPQAAAPSGINLPQSQANNVNQPFGPTPENIPNQSEGGHGGQEGTSPQRGPSSGPGLSERSEDGFSGAGNENIQNHNPRMDISSGEMGTVAQQAVQLVALQQDQQEMWLVLPLEPEPEPVLVRQQAAPQVVRPVVLQQELQ